jgi:Protein of unknown function (DUF2911)
MKNNHQLAALALTLVLVFLGCRGGAHAQSRRVSPHETTMATVDGSAMAIEYGRPSMRGRTIFGGLVRYNDVWCPGADEATMLSTSRPLRMGQLAVPAGEYSLWILPTESAWTLILNKEAHTFHTNYRGSRDLGRVAMQKRTLSAPVEQLTFAIEPNSTGSGGRLVMTWATTEVSVPFLVGE